MKFPILITYLHLKSNCEKENCVSVSPMDRRRRRQWKKSAKVSPHDAKEK